MLVDSPLAARLERQREQLELSERHQREEDVGEVFRFLCGQNYKSASDGHESVALMHSRDSRTCIAEPLQMLLVLPLHFGNALADC